MPRRHFELHFAERIGWLRAAVMGANDGIVSTASLVVGVAAAEVTRGNVLISGMGGLAARTGGAPITVGAGRVAFWGALAMAATAGLGALLGAVV